MAGTTTNYGFNYPTSTDLVKDGASAMQTLATNVDTTLFTALGGAYAGLRLIKKQTIGTGVSSVTVTDAFSSTYENYLIRISGGVASVDDSAGLQLGASTTGYSGALTYVPYATNVPASATDNNTTQFRYIWRTTVGQPTANINLAGPFLAKPTIVSGTWIASSAGGNYVGYHSVATSYTSFTLLPNSGTLTGGTIYVYGYGAS